MNPSITEYHSKLNADYLEICIRLCALIDEELPTAESKIWHSHPVWFLLGNPIVGYSIEKKGVRLMFWSGADFNEPKLNVLGKKFKDASIYFQLADQLDIPLIKRCLALSKEIQWDYKNIVKRKGQLIKLES